MVVEKAYAKINLGLEVVRKREDNYHDLDMVMTSISLWDELYFDELSVDRIEIDCDKMKDIKLENNLIYKAAMLIKKQFNIDKGLKIKVIKNIPEQAGLGGGSADAAATLRALNTLWKLGLSLDELAKLAIEIGSDVPFCIYNKTARVSGKGGVLEFIDEVPFLNLILVIPPFKASTADVFNSFKIHRRNKGKIEKLIKAIESKDIDDISDNLFNDLEYSYFYKEISKIKIDLVASGAKVALMTGSGSTVYGICLNEKDAIRVNNKFIQTNKAMNTIFVQTRSNIKYKWSGQARSQIKFKSLDSTKTKAYCYIPLVYQRILDDYILIESPVSLYNEVFIEKISNKVNEVYINEYLEVNELTKYLEKLVDYLDYGLRVKIKEGLNSGFDLICPENYLATIIRSLEDFGEDKEKLFALFNNKVQAYKDNKVFYYASKGDALEILDDVPFGHVLIADLGIKDYKNPKYTKQITKGIEIDEVLEGIKTKNFYRVAENLYNSLTKFETRKIEASSNLKINKLKNDCLKFGAQGFLLNVNGKSIICFIRYEKHLNSVKNILKNFHNLRKVLVTGLKSNVTHQFSESRVFIELNQEDLAIEQKEGTQELGLFDKKPIDVEDYSRYDFDDFTNPFDVTKEIDNLFSKESRSKPKKQVTSAKEISKDIEGILHIHSGGSLFKLYDFKEIAKYFQKYFDNRKIRFKIDGNISSVTFKVQNLPHLLGLHKLDPEDENLRGLKGFKKLLDGQLTYKNLKNRVDNKIFDQIIKRTQGLVLIFNDFYHGRDDELICYDKDIISKDDTKLSDKLKYGITRGVARNQFHTRNVLGIGFEENSNYNYFITLFLWDAQASLGKKEGYKVEIVK